MTPILLLNEDPKRYRIPRQRISLVRDGSLLSSWKVFANSRQIFEFAREQLYADVDREQFHCLMLDSKNRLIGVNLVAQGTLSSCIVSSSECYKPAILSNASAVAFTHPHPSGDCAPSREDRECTVRLVKAGKILGIRVLDHVVCGSMDYFSFADAGILEERSEDVHEVAAGFNAAGKGAIKPETMKRRIQMKTKNERKGRKPVETKPAKSAKPSAPVGKSTIKQVVVDSIAANSSISNDEMVAAVKAQFPESAFDARHAAWYRSQARKGALTGTPINIPQQTRKSSAESE
jgi:DNA repair protein RadC